jgi:hypothetical protein
MANLTIVVDEETLRQARIRALEQGTSVNAVLAEYLRKFAGQRGQQQRALRSLLSLAKQNAQGSCQRRARRRGPRSWTRDDLHER